MPRRLALLLLLPACIVITDNDGEPDDIDSVIVLDDPDDPCPGEPAWVTAATLDGNDLIVDAGYGGCHEARVWACWNGLILDSLPGQVIVEIHHGESGDCDAAFQGTYRFHLDPMLDLVRESPLIIHAGEQTVTWGAER